MKRLMRALSILLLLSLAAEPSSGDQQDQKGGTEMKKAARSTVKSVDIDAPVGKVFDFISNPLNWPKYAVVNLKSVTPGKDGWFNMVTRFGAGQLKINPVRELGIFDHVWRDEQASWTVPARVVPNNDGCTVMMTLFQPAAMSNEQFDQAMIEMDKEMRVLKTLLEDQTSK